MVWSSRKQWVHQRKLVSVRQGLQWHGMLHSFSANVGDLPSGAAIDVRVGSVRRRVGWYQDQDAQRDLPGRWNGLECLQLWGMEHKRLCFRLRCHDAFKWRLLFLDPRHAKWSEPDRRRLDARLYGKHHGNLHKWHLEF